MPEEPRPVSQLPHGPGSGTFFPVTAVASIRLRKGEELRYLWIGLGSSLAMHALFFLLWLSLSVMAVSLQDKLLKELQTRALTEEQRRKQEPPLLFVEVRPDQAAPEPPKDAKYYSALNSLAANPDPQIDTTVPKIEGKQDKVVKTFDTLHPQLPQPAPPPEPLPEEKPIESKQPGGDINLVKPADKPQRPRTVLEARLRDPGLLAGEKMKQEGGVKRRGTVSLDAKATPFGAYDAIVFQAIQKRWYDLLDDSATPSRQGRVVIEVRMHSDGSITDLKVVQQDVGEILSLYCRKAINDPAPFAPWPGEMRAMIGQDYRNVSITFFYQ
jgi:hypothetical protein